MAIALPEYCGELMKQVERETRFPLEIQSEPILEFDSELQLRTSGSHSHLLRYSSAYEEHLAHFVVNSCFKILRTHRAPPLRRFVAAREEGRMLPEPYHQELVVLLRRTGISRAEEYATGASAFICAGLTRQLTSFPIDLRVEREVYNAPELEGHRPLQRRYLERQVGDFAATLDPAMLTFIPRPIYEASSAMNIAFAEVFARIADLEPSMTFKAHSSRPQGMKLLEALEQTREPGVEGDKQLVDAWAEELGLQGWYRWVRLGESDHD